MDLLKDYTGGNLNFVTSKKLFFKLNGFQKSNLILLQKKGLFKFGTREHQRFRFLNLYHTRETELKIVI